MTSSIRLTTPPRLTTLLTPSAYGPSFPSSAPPSIPTDIYNAFLHPAVPITIATVYAISIHWLNHKADGTPYRISKTRAFKVFVIIHNLLLAVYSAWTFVGMSRLINQTFIQPHLRVGGGLDATGLVDTMCKIQDRVNGHVAFSSGIHGNYTDSLLASAANQEEMVRQGLWSAGLSFYGWFFYLSKFYEVLDTLIILAKGRKSSTLQTYHHSGAMLSMWAGIRWMSPPIWLFCWFNSGIHTLMYTYYTFSALKVRVPQVIKRTLTTMQISQFLIGGSTAAAYLFVKYRREGDGSYQKCLSSVGEELAVVINCVYLAPLTYLFMRFFVRSYITGGGAKKLDKGKQRAVAEKKEL